MSIYEEERKRVLSCCDSAREAARDIISLSTAKKNLLLEKVATALDKNVPSILTANERDLRENSHLSDSIKDRLRLDSDRIAAITAAVRNLANLHDPVGEVLDERTMYNGIHMKKVRVPLGVMAMVYEARPNVTVDAFGLSFKTNNVVLLRGSRTAWHTNQELVRIIRGTLAENAVNPDAIILLPCQTHESVHDLITARGLVDVVIPRGGQGLIRAVVDNATVPTLETGAGNCHVYVDMSADIDMAIDIIINGKTRRCSVCNATETVLIDSRLDQDSIRKILQALIAAGVRIHGEPKELDPFDIEFEPATEKDWEEEYLSLDIAVKLVRGVLEAVDHIDRYSTNHTEAIVATDQETIDAFTMMVDSAAVMVNASTAFTDGEQYGMGAEIGISTQKLHARGPMALPELTSYKWILVGEGQTRS